MTKYRIQLTTSSTRDIDTVTRFFEKALKLGGFTAITLRVTPLKRGGRPMTQTGKVVSWVSKQNRTDRFTVAQLSKELEINRSTVWKALQRMVEAGWITKDSSWSVDMYQRVPKVKPIRSHENKPGHGEG